jgi:hypothetical protein
MIRTILDEWKDRLEERVARGEITPESADTYLNNATRVIETLLRAVPAEVIAGYMASEGYEGDYGYVIRSLKQLARLPGHLRFED